MTAPELGARRIAVLTSSYPRAPSDAGGHFVASEATRWLEQGFEVHVFAPGAGPATNGAVRVHWLGDHGSFGWPGALPRLRENPARAWGVAEFVLRASHALRRAGPFTRLQAHFLLPSGWPIATLAFGRGAATEIELVGHGSDVRLFCRLPKWLRKQIARAWLARRVRLRVTSHELYALLRAAQPELADSTRVMASPIDVGDVPDRRTARQTLGLDDSAVLAVIVARLIPEKGVALALRALALHDGVHVRVVGDGPEFAPLSARFPEVHFMGRLERSQALRVIAAADVLVSASAEEGAPSVVREARLLGVPVVARVAGDLAAWAERDAGILLAR